MSDSTVWYRIDLPYACFGIESKDGVVVRSAPIGRWMIGKTVESVESWVNKKRGSIAPIA